MLLEQHERRGLAHDVASANHDGFLARNLDACGFQDSQDSLDSQDSPPLKFLEFLGFSNDVIESA
jgi:hypothetical protein